MNNNQIRLLKVGKNAIRKRLTFPVDKQLEHFFGEKNDGQLDMQSLLI